MRFALLPLAFLAACATRSDPAAGCGAPAGWEAVAEAASGGVLIVGESHGTAEVPIAFSSYACAVAASRGPTLVLFELDVEDEPALLEAWDAVDTEAALLNGEIAEHWRSLDGRGSEAMMYAVTRLAELKKEGLPLSVGAFDTFVVPEPPADVRTPEQVRTWFAGLDQTLLNAEREKAQAAGIERRTDGFDNVVVLVGNLHAMKARPSADFPYDPMAMHLSGGVVSVNVITDGGTRFGTGSRDGVPEEGLVPLEASERRPDRLPPPPSMGLTDALTPRFDGYLYVGAVTASPPANDLPDAGGSSAD